MNWYSRGGPSDDPGGTGAGNDGYPTTAAMFLGILTSIPLLIMCLTIGAPLSSGGAGGLISLGLYTGVSLVGGVVLVRRNARASRSFGLGLMIGWALLGILTAVCVSSLALYN